MADWGQLANIGEGLERGTAGFLQQYNLAKERKRQTEQDALAKRLQDVALKEKGYAPGPSGEYELTPEGQAEKELAGFKTEADIGSKGFKIGVDPATGKRGLIPIEGFIDPRKQLQSLQIQKLQQELGKGPEYKKEQTEAATFASRARQSEAVFKQLAEKGFDPASLSAGASRNLPGFLEGMKGAQQKSQEQAERSFINAILRRESGASISPSEFASAEAQYFPRVGDSPEVLAQKAENRRISTEGLIAGAGPAMAPFERQLGKINVNVPGKQKGLIPSATAGESSEKVIGGVKYKKVPGGWEEVR